MTTDDFNAMPRLRKCCGIDIQGNEVVAVKAEKIRGSVVFSTATTAEISSDNLAAAACVTAKESFTRWLNTPFANAGKSTKVLPSLLDIKLPFPLEDCSCSFLDIAPDKKQNTTRALAVAARHVDLQKKLDLLAKYRVDPQIIDHEGLALWTQSIKEKNIGKNNIRIVVYLGTDRSTMAVGAYDRYLNSHGLDPDDPQQIKRLIRVDLEKTTRENPDNPRNIEMAFTGPRAKDPDLSRRFSEQVADIGNHSSFTHDDPERFLARALAERLLSPGPLRCNLRTGQLSHRAIIQRTKSRSLKAILSCLAAGLILIIGNFAARQLARQSELSFRKELISAYTEITGKEPVNFETGALLKNARNQLEKNAVLYEPFITAFKPSLAETITDIAKTAEKKEIGIESLILSHDTVSLSGASSGWKDCEPLVNLLKNLGYAVVANRNESLADEKTVFMISDGEIREQ